MLRLVAGSLRSTQTDPAIACHYAAEAHTGYCFGNINSLLLLVLTFIMNAIRRFYLYGCVIFAKEFVSVTNLAVDIGFLYFRLTFIDS